MTQDEAKALVRRMYHAANTGDIAAVDEIFAPDFYSHPLQQSGIEPIRKGWITILGKFPDLRVEAEDILVHGDKVAVRDHPQHDSGPRRTKADSDRDVPGGRRPHRRTLGRHHPSVALIIDQWTRHVVDVH